MTKSDALYKLLALGALTRRELNQITGWKKSQVSGTLQYLSMTGKIVYERPVWRLDEGLRS